MPERPDLVLVAGWGLSARVWEPLLPFLEPAFRLHAFDLLAEDADPGDMADRLFSLAPARAQWLGWSLGGEVALLAARRHPGHISRLHLWAVNPCFVARPDYPHAMPAATFRAFRENFRRDPEAAWRRFLALQCQGGASPRQTLRRLQALAGDQLPLASDVLDRQLGWLESLDLRDEMVSVPCPVSRLTGERDALIPVTAGQCTGTVPVTVLPDESHVFFLSAPENAARELFRAAEVLP